MNDCPNADVRDLLPDLMHGRLDSATRTMVESHLAGCVDCRAELALLGNLRASMARAAALDVGAIAAAVPAYRAPVVRTWVGWRTAAAAALIIAGGSSIIVTQRIGHRVPDVVAVSDRVVEAAPPQQLPQTESVVHGPAPVSSSPQPSTTPRSAGSSSIEPASRELAVAGGTLTDLSDRELASLLEEIDSLDALPSTDVENVPISPLAPRRGTP